MRNTLIIICLLFSPLLVFGQQQDSIREGKIRAWRLTRLGRQDSVAMDTLLYDSHHYNPALGQNNLGHLAAPMRHKLFYQRRQNPFLFLSPYDAHLKTNGNTRYINTRYPFTLLKYATSTQKDNEDMLQVRHSQNVNKKLNFGIDLNLSASKKFYENERTLNAHFLNFFGSYESRPYSLYANANINKIELTEYGGIASRSDFEVNLQRVIPGKLQDAKHLLKNKSLHVIQTLSLKKSSLARMRLLDQIDRQSLARQKDTIIQDTSGVPADTLSADTLPNDSFSTDTLIADSLTPDSAALQMERGDTLAPAKDTLIEEDQTRFYLYHHLSLNTNSKRYDDGNPTSEFYSSFPILMDSSKTRDEALQKSLRNEIKLVYSNKFAEVSAGMDYDLLQYAFTEPQTDTGAPDYDRFTKRNYNNLSLTGELSFRADTSFIFTSQGRYYFSGFKSGDLFLSGTLYKSLGNNGFTLKGRYKRYEPDYFLQHYNANHFRWDQRLSKTREIMAELQYNLNSWKTRFALKPALIRYYTYLDTLARPDQYTGELKFLEASLEKDFQFWKIHSTNKIVFQYAEPSEVLSLPMLYVYHRFALRHRFRFEVTGGKLDTQLGWSLYYTPAYHADAYMPALGLYHRQRKEMIGNRPLFTLFANMQLKRTRMFIKFYHLSSLLLPRDYYTSPGYPRAPVNQMIKFGVSWSFYD
jgi:hypothetical protein